MRHPACWAAVPTRYEPFVQFADLLSFSPGLLLHTSLSAAGQNRCCVFWNTTNGGIITFDSPLPHVPHKSYGSLSDSCRNNGGVWATRKFLCHHRGSAVAHTLGVVRCSIFGRTCWEMHPEVAGLTSGPRYAGNHFSAQKQAPTRWHRRDLRLRTRNREKSSRSLPLFGRADVFWLGEKDCRL